MEQIQHEVGPTAANGFCDPPDASEGPYIVPPMVVLDVVGRHVFVNVYHTAYCSETAVGAFQQYCFLGVRD